jgi:hypothetical protein
MPPIQRHSDARLSFMPDGGVPVRMDVFLALRFFA